MVLYYVELRVACVKYTVVFNARWYVQGMV